MSKISERLLADLKKGKSIEEALRPLMNLEQRDKRTIDRSLLEGRTTVGGRQVNFDEDEAEATLMVEELIPQIRKSPIPLNDVVTYNVNEDVGIVEVMVSKRSTMFLDADDLVNLSRWPYGSAGFSELGWSRGELSFIFDVD